MSRSINWIYVSYIRFGELLCGEFSKFHPRHRLGKVYLFVYWKIFSLSPTHGSCGQKWKQKVSTKCTINIIQGVKWDKTQTLDTCHSHYLSSQIGFPWCSLLSDHHVSHPWHLAPSVGESLGELLACVRCARVRTRLMSSGQCGETQERFRIPGAMSLCMNMPEVPSAGCMSGVGSQHRECPQHSIS